jgi:hypothetical protein
VDRSPTTRPTISIVELIGIAAAIFLVAAVGCWAAARISSDAHLPSQPHLILAISEQSVPASASSALSGAAATPASEPAEGDEWQRVTPNNSAPEAGVSSSPAKGGEAPAEAVSPPPASSGTEEGSEPAATAAPTPLAPALDVSALPSGPDLAAASLEPEIRQAPSPARAASLRITEQARLELAKGSTDAALRELNRAVSIDPGDPFEYYYLGRTYLARKNYAQALTFFQRAELGFNGRPNWLGETQSFEGACQEAMGQMEAAAKSYKRAIDLAPGNFRAQAGYGRLAASAGPITGINLPAPGADGVSAPPPGTEAPPPPDEIPPPPANSD